MKKITPFGIAGLVLSLFLLLMNAGCGNGGGGAAAPAAPAALQKVQGVAQKGPFKEGSVVKAYKYTTEKGDLLAQTTVDANAAYTLPAFNYVGPVLIQVTGQYLNELTGDYENDYATTPFETMIVTEEVTTQTTYKANVSPASALATAIIKKQIAKKVSAGETPTVDDVKGVVYSSYATVADFLGLDVTAGKEVLNDIAQIDIRGTSANDKAVAVFNAKVLKAVTSDGVFDVAAGEKVKLSSLVDEMAAAYVDQGDIDKVDTSKLEVVDTTTGETKTTGVSTATGFTANNVFDDIVKNVTLTSDEVASINTNLNPSENITTTDVTNVETKASASLKALALTDNKVTFAKGTTNEVSGAIDNAGKFPASGTFAIAADAERTITFTLDNVSVPEGTYTLNMAFSVNDKAVQSGKTAKREIKALIKGVQLVVSSSGASLTVPDDTTVYWSGQTSAGTAIKGYINNLSSNGPVFATDGSSFTFNGTALSEKIADKFGESSGIVSFQEAGTYEFQVAVSGVNLGYVSSGKITNLLPFATITVQKTSG